jgi:hypothetical protein
VAHGPLVTELTAKTNIFFVLFDGKNVLWKYTSNNFDLLKKKTLSELCR